ncbi:MAG: DUF4339 domain-containing protein [Polyangiaceae bacterium]|nr:DUF4339 domain-containing protein [Polyangiaceae bacterium]
MAASDEWRWTDDQGVQRVVRADELRSALLSSVLAPSTLVWREGMERWVPASTIPELYGVDAMSDASTTDASMAAPTLDDTAGRATSGSSNAARSPEPPPLVLPDRVVQNAPQAGSRADTGRPTPTELLQSGQSANASASGAPRPAAGQAPIAAPLKISAAPAPRPVTQGRNNTKVESATASKAGASAWRKPTKAKADEDVTLVADAHEAFKLKSPSENAPPAAPKEEPKEAPKEPSRVASSLATRRPVTRTAVLPNEPVGRRETKSIAQSRPASAPPPHPLPVRKNPSVPPAVVPRPPNTSPPPANRTPDPARSTAFMGTRGAGGDVENPKIPAAPRIGEFPKSGFAIVENTSTDSTGVLPLGGSYATEPTVDRAALPSYTEGAPPFAERTPMGASGSVKVAPMPASALASYPPVPAPMGVAPAMSPRVDGELHGRPHNEGARPASQPPPAHAHVQARVPLPSHPPPGHSPGGYSAPPPPYSAPPPPMALGSPGVPEFKGAAAPDAPQGELRATGVMPLVNPKRTHSPNADPDASERPIQSIPPPGKAGDPVVVPLSSLFGAGAMLIAMAVSAFFVGRCSVGTQPSNTQVRAVLGAVPQLARAAVPSPPKPCWMAKQPVRWAPGVLQSVPADVAPAPNGVVVAYARDTRETGLVSVDFSTGSFEDKSVDKSEADIARVFAPRDGGKLVYTTKGAAGPLAPFVYTPNAAPKVLGIAARGTPSASVSIADSPDASPASLWNVPPVDDDKGLDAARVLALPPDQYAVVFRRGGNILGGFFGDDRKPRGDLGVVTGSGGNIGKPSLGTNGREIGVIFADKATADGAWEIRVGRAPLGGMPRETVVIPLPKGGPGGDAFAPDIAGIPDGRWVIVWTEGKSGAYAVRAQTFASDFKPLGDPIAVSPPAGNFGQAVVGVAGGYVTTMFLSKGATGSYELWGAVLQCGS